MLGWFFGVCILVIVICAVSQYVGCVAANYVTHSAIARCYIFRNAHLSRHARTLEHRHSSCWHAIKLGAVWVFVRVCSWCRCFLGSGKIDWAALRGLQGLRVAHRFWSQQSHSHRLGRLSRVRGSLLNVLFWVFTHTFPYPLAFQVHL